jgi:hypothetical protein
VKLYEYLFKKDSLTEIEKDEEKQQKTRSPTQIDDDDDMMDIGDEHKYEDL